MTLSKNGSKYRGVWLALMVTVALLGGNPTSSSAHVQTAPSGTVFNNGHGEFNATSAPNAQGCADYSNYSATLAFNHSSPVVTATVRSSTDPTHPDFIWGEYADGTYNQPGPNVICPGKDSPHGNPPPSGATGRGGDAITGFTGTLVSSTGSINCTLTEGTYTRGHLGDYIEDPSPAPYNHPELNIAFVFDSASGTNCPSTLPVVLKTTIVHVDIVPADPNLGPYTTSCNSPIAPQTCQLDHQENTAAW